MQTVRGIEAKSRKAKVKVPVAPFCGNCRYGKHGCLSTDRCVECKADEAEGLGKTGFRPKKFTVENGKTDYTGKRKAKLEFSNRHLGRS